MRSDLRRQLTLGATASAEFAAGYVGLLAAVIGTRPGRVDLLGDGIEALQLLGCHVSLLDYSTPLSMAENVIAGEDTLLFSTSHELMHLILQMQVCVLDGTDRAVLPDDLDDQSHEGNGQDQDQQFEHRNRGVPPEFIDPAEQRERADGHSNCQR